MGPYAREGGRRYHPFHSTCVLSSLPLPLLSAGSEPASHRAAQGGKSASILPWAEGRGRGRAGGRVGGGETTVDLQKLEHHQGRETDSPNPPARAHEQTTSLFQRARALFSLCPHLYRSPYPPSLFASALRLCVSFVGFLRPPRPAASQHYGHVVE
jgi:hypothetical protein